MWSLNMATRTTDFGTIECKIRPVDIENLSKLTQSLLRLYHARLDDDGYLVYDLPNYLIADITRETGDPA